MYQIHIQTRDYSSFYFTDAETHEKVVLEITHPDILQNNMFSQDLFSFQENKITIHSSLVRHQSIPGILILENNKTYGRTPNKKRLYYKCIPHNKQLPAFLVPYEIQLGFHKKMQNKYVTFRFDHWTGQHPHGLLLQTLGNVDDLPVFYEYQLYCRELHQTLTPFIQRTKTLQEKDIQDILLEDRWGFEDRRKTHRVFSIDPPGSTDLDDALSIRQLDPGFYEISIYIANVFVWMEHYQLWDSFSERVATIYLPDKRRPMLPTFFSENACSLLQGKDRIAFTLTVRMNTEGVISETRFSQSILHVDKNYHYDDDMMKDADYNRLYDLTRKRAPEVGNSHELVAHWMIYMNTLSADTLYRHQTGMFRSAVAVQGLWNHYMGKYVLYGGETNLAHESLQVERYVHITSPIRRLVDIVNQTLLIQKLALCDVSVDAIRFVETRMNQIEHINQQMKAIRKVQCDCDLVYTCFTHPEMTTREHKGIICEKKVDVETGLYHYILYLEELSLMARMKCPVDLDISSHHSFQLCLFQDEDKIQKKIQWQLHRP